MKDALDAALAPATSAVDSNNTPRVSLLSFISDLYLCKRPCYTHHESPIQYFLAAYVFWSTFTALIPSLFYFSVWELGVSGQELALLSLLSPALLVSSLAVHLSTRMGQVMAYYAQFGALVAFLSSSPVVRLGVVAISCAVMMQREVVLLAGLVTGEGAKNGKGLGYWSVRKLLFHAANESDVQGPFCSDYARIYRCILVEARQPRQ